MALRKKPTRRGSCPAARPTSPRSATAVHQCPIDEARSARHKNGGLVRPPTKRTRLMFRDSSNGAERNAPSRDHGRSDSPDPARERTPKTRGARKGPAPSTGAGRSAPRAGARENQGGIQSHRRGADGLRPAFGKPGASRPQCAVQQEHCIGRRQRQHAAQGPPQHRGSRRGPRDVVAAIERREPRALLAEWWGTHMITLYVGIIPTYRDTADLAIARESNLWDCVPLGMRLVQAP